VRQFSRPSFFARVAILVEALREPAFGAGEANEVIYFVRLGFDREILFLDWIALEAEALQVFLGLNCEEVLEHYF
jgi:hypothetical protein